MFRQSSGVILSFLFKDTASKANSSIRDYIKMLDSLTLDALQMRSVENIYLQYDVFITLLVSRYIPDKQQEIREAQVSKSNNKQQKIDKLNKDLKEMKQALVDYQEGKRHYHDVHITKQKQLKNDWSDRMTLFVIAAPGAVFDFIKAERPEFMEWITKRYSGSDEWKYAETN